MGLPLDALFWCAGCQGGMYPLTGNVAAHVGGVQASLLAAERLVYRLHRLGLAWGTSGLGRALRALPDAHHEEVAVPLADDAAGAGDFAAHRLQPHGALLGAVGDASRAPRGGRELRLSALEKTFMLHALTAPGAAPVRSIAAALACALVLAGCCRPAWAEQPSAEALARDLAAEVLRKAGDREDGLGAWTEEVIGRALERAAGAAPPEPGTAASPRPLPAERHAAALATARPNTADVIVFMSLSVPAESWREWAREAERLGAALVLRGVGAEGFRETVVALGERLGAARAGVAIDPRLFRLFRIDRVPAVAVVPGGVPACRSRGCSAEPAPPHDLVAGNVGLAGALEAVAAEGGSGRNVAGQRLAVLRGEAR